MNGGHGPHDRTGRLQRRPRAAAVPVELEKELQNRLTQTATICGWLWIHHYDSRRSTIGFPDLVMVRDGQMLVIECKRGPAEQRAMAKSEEGRAQLAWIAEMDRVPGCLAWVVSPENEGEALARITARRTA